MSHIALVWGKVIYIILNMKTKFEGLKEMKLKFDKRVNCGVNASRRANSVVINDASGGPIRVCLKHVYGCLTLPNP